MTRFDCPVCSGEGRVRLHHHRPMSVADLSATPNMPETAELDYKVYPCPECSGTVSESLVYAEVVCSEMDLPEEVERQRPSVVNAMRASIAARIGDHLMNNDLVTFERFRISPTRVALRGVVGLVRRDQAQSIEDRIAARQAELADELAAEVKREVVRWRSNAREGSIDRGDVNHLVDEAARTVAKRRRPTCRP